MITDHNRLKQLSACLIATNRHIEVENLLKKHINGENGTELRYYLALAYARQEKTKDALNEIEKVLEKKPDSKPTRKLAFKLYIHQARLKIKEKDYKGLSSAITNALKIAPEDAVLHKEFAGFKNFLPLSYLKTGNREEAARIWEEELKQEPNSHRVIHNLALLYYWWAIETEDETEEEEEKDDKGRDDNKPEKVGFFSKISSLLKGGRASEKENNKGDGEIGRKALVWKKAISYWVMLVNMEDFWKEWKREREELCSIKIKEGDIKELRNKLIDDRFNKVFHDYIDQHKQNGREEDSARHEDYLTTLMLEKKTASYYKEVVSRVKKLGIKMDGSMKRWELIRAIQEMEGISPCFATKKGECKDMDACYWSEYCVQDSSLWNKSVSISIPCGPLIFKEMDILSEVHKLIELSCKTGVVNEKLSKLRIYLSPLGKVLILIEDQRKLQKAIKEWKRLPGDVRESGDGRYVYALALLERGKGQLEVADIEKALSDWADAKQSVIEAIGITIGEKQRVTSRLMSTIEVVNQKIFNTGEKLFISLRDKLDDLVVDSCEKEAKRLKQKDKIDDAIEILTKGLRIVDKKSLKEHLAVFYCDRGLKRIDDEKFLDARKDFEKALSFDSDNKRAKESIGTAYNNEGVAKGKKGNRDSAIKLYEKALEYDPDSEVVKENLAGAYNGKAVDILNASDCYSSHCDKAIDSLKKGLKLLNPNIAKFILDGDPYRYQLTRPTTRPTIGEPKLLTMLSRPRLGLTKDMTEEMAFNDSVKDLPDGLYKTMLRNIWIAYGNKRNLS